MGLNDYVQPRMLSYRFGPRRDDRELIVKVSECRVMNNPVTAHLLSIQSVDSVVCFGHVGLSKQPLPDVASDPGRVSPGPQ